MYLDFHVIADLIFHLLPLLKFMSCPVIKMSHVPHFDSSHFETFLIESSNENSARVSFKVFWLTSGFLKIGTAHFVMLTQNII